MNFKEISPSYVVSDKRLRLVLFSVPFGPHDCLAAAGLQNSWPLSGGVFLYRGRPLRTCPLVGQGQDPALAEKSSSVGEYWLIPLAVISKFPAYLGAMRHVM